MKTNSCFFMMGAILTFVFCGPASFGQGFELLSDHVYMEIGAVDISEENMVFVGSEFDTEKWKFVITDGTIEGTREVASYDNGWTPFLQESKLIMNEHYVYFQEFEYGGVYYIDLQNALSLNWLEVSNDYIDFLTKWNNGVYGLCDYGYYFINGINVSYRPFIGWRLYFTRPFVHESGIYYSGEYADSLVSQRNIFKVTDYGNEIIADLGDTYWGYENPESFGSIGEHVFAFVTKKDGSGFHTELFEVNDAGVDSLFAFPYQMSIQGVRRFKDYMYLLLTEHIYEGEEYSEQHYLWRTDGTTAGTEYLEYLGVSYDRSIGDDIICDYESDYLGCKPNLRSNIYENEEGKYYFLSEAGGLNLYTPDGLYTSSSPVGYLRILGVLGDNLIVVTGNKLYKYHMGTNCGARAVIAFNQGKKKSGAPVPSGRSNPQMSLGDPQENDEINFVALGFGGSITLALGTTVYDEGTAEPDLILVETSFGRADQFCYSEGVSNYPEQAFVEVSEDGVNWYSLPNVYCRTSFIDIKPAVDQGMAYASFIRITDVSNPLVFQNSADGFDLDGVITCREEVEAAKGLLTNARIATSSLFNSQFINKAPDEVEEGFTLYPNPVTNGELTLQFKVSQAQEAYIRVIDITGKEKLLKTVSLSAGTNAVKLEVSALSKGTYIVELSAGDRVENTKIIIQ